MPQFTNHLVDPTFFFDAIEEFSFTYNIYVAVDNDEIDEYGNRIWKYKKNSIRGSLQSRGIAIERSKTGNTHDVRYSFYCKSLYRINIDDIIEYKGNYLQVQSVQDYDEYGCRQAELKMTSLTAHRDLADYIKYLSGEKLI